MPKLKFVKTPTEAEGGPNNKFEEGEVYEVSEKSFRRWLDIGCAVEVDEEVIIKEMKEVKETKEIKPPVVTVDIKPKDDTKKEVIGRGATLGTSYKTKDYEAIESGGQAPPIFVPKK